MAAVNVLLNSVSNLTGYTALVPTSTYHYNCVCTLPEHSTSSSSTGRRQVHAQLIKDGGHLFRWPRNCPETINNGITWHFFISVSLFPQNFSSHLIQAASEASALVFLSLWVNKIKYLGPRCGLSKLVPRGLSSTLNTEKIFNTYCYPSLWNITNFIWDFEWQVEDSRTQTKPRDPQGPPSCPWITGVSEGNDTLLKCDIPATEVVPGEKASGSPIATSSCVFIVQ